MQQLTESILNAVKPANCICFDAEFARGMEMLELSIVDMRGQIGRASCRERVCQYV